MGLADELFYDLIPEIVDIFVEDTELTTFRVTKVSVRMLEHPNNVNEYHAPQLIEIKCPPIYKEEDREDFGGQTRKDITSRRIRGFNVLVPAASIPAGVVLVSTQEQRVEILKDGQYFEVKDMTTINGSAAPVAFILHFGGA